ncbi:MAG: hypothetical protein HW379_1616 [Actinobacteria bacterium]|jgi:hypothetical protein|nr:hypothetical protein [Actinomycetota bacterium]
MSTIEDGTVAGPGLSAIETAITFFVIPVAMFILIAGLSWVASRPRSTKTHSSITSIN